jgi:hypothetical protein
MPRRTSQLLKNLENYITIMMVNLFAIYGTHTRPLMTGEHTSELCVQSFHVVIRITHRQP